MTSNPAANPSGSPAADGSTRRTPARIPAERLEEAASRLTMSQGGPSELRGRRFLEAAQRHGIDLTNFWGAFDPEGRLGQVCLIVPGAGRVAMVFTSPPSGPQEISELAEVLRVGSEQTAGVALTQTLLEGGETGVRRAAEAAGYRWVGDLLYMRRSWRSVDDPGPALPAGVEAVNWRAGDDEELVEALERSYEGTLDCPELCGMRSSRDVLESHRATGEFDPSLWWIVRAQGRPRGALLLSPCPASGHTELSYLGLAPELRGRGVARAVLSRGLARLRRRELRTVMCAVDERNGPARKLYERFGFASAGRRTALVRPRGAEGE